MKNNVSLYHDPFGLINPFFDEFFNGESNSQFNQVMKTDIRDLKDHYEFKVELPEIKKEDIHLSLVNGYLTIEAKHSYENPNKEDNATFIKKERYFGSYKRSYYLGDEVEEKDIYAKLNDGVLTLKINKKAKEEKETKYIPIE